MNILKDGGIQRIILVSFPGKQVTFSHIIACPVSELYERLGIEEKGAIGILTLSPYETSIIAADIATKTANVEIGFLDRFTGSVLVNGDVQSVETALEAVLEKLSTLLNFDVVGITKT